MKNEDAILAISILIVGICTLGAAGVIDAEALRYAAMNVVIYALGGCVAGAVSTALWLTIARINGPHEIYGVGSATFTVLALSLATFELDKKEATEINVFLILISTGAGVFVILSLYNAYQDHLEKRVIGKNKDDWKNMWKR